jgi:hypothetical protein
VKQKGESNLSYLLRSRPLIVKRNGLEVCLHDAFSGEVLAGQAHCELIQSPGEHPVVRVEFVCDGRHVRLGGDQ